MNLPIDLEKRMKLNRRRREMGEKFRIAARDELRRAKAEGKAVANAIAADYVPITLSDVSYAYDSPLAVHKRMQMKDSFHKSPGLSHQPTVDLDKAKADSTKKGDGTLENCTMSFPQGTFVTLVGIPGHGKSSVMRLIGSQIVPDGGDLLIPPHLRALHVSIQPTFFHDSLNANLVYGLSKENKEDGSVERVNAVLREVFSTEEKDKNTCVPRKIADHLKKDNKAMFEVKAEWGEILSTTERSLLSLARAFIANPEILVVHKPTVFFDDATARNMFRCLNDFIIQRGLCMDPATVDHRRPRTCIITTARPQGVEVADVIFRVTPTITNHIKRKSDITAAELK